MHLIGIPFPPFAYSKRKLSDRHPVRASRALEAEKKQNKTKDLSAKSNRISKNMKDNSGNR